MKAKEAGEATGPEGTRPRLQTGEIRGRTSTQAPTINRPLTTHLTGLQKWEFQVDGSEIAGGDARGGEFFDFGLAMGGSFQPFNPRGGRGVGMDTQKGTFL